jgi:putative acetyltransferase
VTAAANATGGRPSAGDEHLADAGLPGALEVPGGLHIRAARDEDAEGVMALVAACFSEYEGCILDTGEMPHLLALATHFRDQGGGAWVVVRAGEVVGSVAWRPRPAAGSELHMLYVAADTRRHGLGTTLVALVEAAARGTGAITVDLWSDTRFLDAHRLYDRLGYVMNPETRELHDRSATVELHFTKALGR